MNISENVGRNIRFYRKSRDLTLSELGEKIFKGKAVISKYEKGQISIDIQTLYEIATVLQVNLEQLLYSDEQDSWLDNKNDYIPSFFQNTNKLYGYFYDGRDESINESVITITQMKTSDQTEYHATLFLNINDRQHFHSCEYTYHGNLHHYDALSIFTLQNNNTAMEELKISVPASYTSAEEKFALFNGVSSRPLMPVSLKMLLSKSQIEKNAALTEKLKISKADLKSIKLYNFLSVT